MDIQKEVFQNGLINVLSVKYKLTIQSLEHHDVFNTCARVEKKVSFMKFYTHGEYDVSKSKMCKDFVKYKIKVCSESFADILKQDIESMKSDEFKMYIIEAQSQMHVEYIEAIEKDWRNKRTSRKTTSNI